MLFLEHLDELRSRLIRACLAIAAGMLVAFFFVDRLADVVLAPTLRALPAGASLVTTKPGEGFAFYFDVALIGGVVLAAPIVMYQVWRFVAPGLYAREKRLVVPFVLMAAGGTVAGALFSHVILFPSTMTFFGAFDSPAMKFMPRVEDTFGLYKNMLLGMVAVFQLPTLVFFMARLRLVTARFLWRNIKYAILIVFVVAAVLTSSPDPWNQTVVAAPMLAMYLLSIAIAWLVRPRDDDPSDPSSGMRLVVSAAVFEQVRRQREGGPRRFARRGIVRRRPSNAATPR
jgi:sec-independent protein translocase protein TatC